MPSSNPPANSSTPANATVEHEAAPHTQPQEDFAMGWECANPALQIERWGQEDTAQALQRFH
jgi:hypothetical protein